MGTIVYQLDNNGNRTEVGEWSSSLSLREVLVCAVNQVLLGNYYSWNYEKKWNVQTGQYEPYPLPIKETERLFIYPFGDNSCLFVHKS